MNNEKNNWYVMLCIASLVGGITGAATHWFINRYSNKAPLYLTVRIDEVIAKQVSEQSKIPANNDPATAKAAAERFGHALEAELDEMSRQGAIVFSSNAVLRGAGDATKQFEIGVAHRLDEISNTQTLGQIGQ